MKTQEQRGTKICVFLFAELTIGPQPGVLPFYYLLQLQRWKEAHRQLALVATELQTVSQTFTHPSLIQAHRLLLLPQLSEVPWLDQYPQVCLCLKQKETQVKGEYTGDQVQGD